MTDAYAAPSTPTANAMAHGSSAPSPVATDAPSGIGSLVASFGILELEKLLSEESEHALVGRELCRRSPLQPLAMVPG